MRKVIAINGSPRKNEASNFDVEKKKKAREKMFPKDCKKAYGIGERIAVRRDNR